MKLLSKIVTCAGAVLFCSSLSAQTVERQVIASGGADQSATGVELSSTIGESITASFSSGTIILDQGFQQGDMMSTSLEENKIHIEYKVYPNPTQNQITVSFTADNNLEGVVELISLEGKQIFSKSIQLKSGQTFKDNYTLQNLPVGMYILTLRTNNGEAKVVEKIQKVN